MLLQEDKAHQSSRAQVQEKHTPTSPVDMHSHDRLYALQPKSANVHQTVQANINPTKLIFLK